MTLRSVCQILTVVLIAILKITNACSPSVPKASFEYQTKVAFNRSISEAEQTILNDLLSAFVQKNVNYVTQEGTRIFFLEALPSYTNLNQTGYANFRISPEKLTTNETDLLKTSVIQNLEQIWTSPDPPSVIMADINEIPVAWLANRFNQLWQKRKQSFRLDNAIFNNYYL